jgi:FMN phosphatase YigB (HAD superfamily)
VEAALGIAAQQILLIDDAAANIEAALARGWDAIHFTANPPLLAELARRGLP